MAQKGCQRYDAWGNKILPYPSMKVYYKDDKESLKILDALMPHRFVCIPTVEIRISTQDCRSVTVYLIYPGETRETHVELSERAVEGLRHTWKGKKGWKTSKVGNSFLVLRREGRVIREPIRKFGIYR